MVFTSAPPYHDSSNWQSRQIIGSTGGNPPPQQQNAGLGSGLESGTARVGSMTERARLANIPIPEAALKCPRCDSSNTKFCYFNNYSLSQPRHFCKTCRRYWTRGGALRTVPVGGGYRHNKRTSKPTSAANSSPAAKKHRHMANSSPTGGGNSGNSSYVRNLLNLTPQQLLPLRFGSPLSQLGENIDMGMNNYAGSDQMGLQLGPTGIFLGTESWKLQQFPFLDASHAGNYQFGGGGSAELGLLSGDRGELRLPAGKISAGSLLSQMSAVKMEEQNPNLSLSTELLSGIQANQHQWNIGTDGGGGPSWAEFSSFSSSSTSNHLL